MPRVVNCASTCANQTSGSAGQYGGSLILTAEREGAGGAAEGASSSDMLVAVADPGYVYRTRRGHQCRGCLFIVLYYTSLRGSST